VTVDRPIMDIPSRCLYSLSLTRVDTMVITVGQNAIPIIKKMRPVETSMRRSYFYLSVCRGMNVAEMCRWG